MTNRGELQLSHAHAASCRLFTLVVQPSDRVHLCLKWRQVLLMMQAMMKMLSRVAESHASKNAQVERDLSTALRVELMT